jgi:two-component system OmpR family sensor kinase
MSEPTWYRSLYWRIALGLFAFLVLTLAAQGALFIWMIDQTAGTMPARSPRRIAGLVASDISTALQTNPSLDIATYVRDQYGRVFAPILVTMRDGTTGANHDVEPGDLPPHDGEPTFRELLERGWEAAPIIIQGERVGRVAVLARFPRERMLRELGPTMLTVGVAVLGVGMTLIAGLVFGPARRRLKAVQDAAERLGQGDAAARAPERGGDEVSSVAQSFNRMADELARRAAALDASDRARRQLLADVSHELMTPLTAMRGYVETLSMPEVTLDEATRARYLGIIDDETHRLERIVGDLLDLAKLEGGGASLRHEPVRVEDLFRRVLERHEPGRAARNVQFVTRIAPRAEVVHGDADRLEQALQNLAANALRHTPEGGTITLSSSALDGGATLTVRDNGSGIAEEHLPLIFERFYKADASRRASSGSGLGLSIVKAIAEQHGGSVTARNDHGAVFEIALPH